MKGWTFCFALIFTMGASAEVSDAEAERNMQLALKEISAKRSIAAAEEELRKVADFSLAFASLFPKADGDLCQISFELVEQDILEASRLLSSIAAPIDREPETMAAWSTAKAQTWDDAITLAVNAQAQCADSLAMLQQHLILMDDLDAIAISIAEARQHRLVDQQRVAAVESQLSMAIKLYDNAELGTDKRVDELKEALSRIEAATQLAQLAEDNRKVARKLTIRRTGETIFLALMLIALCYRVAR